jgi:hypothetical protein
MNTIEGMPPASYNDIDNLDLTDTKRSTKQQMETNQGDEKSSFDSEVRPWKRTKDTSPLILAFY